jgi:hypothetical protein
MKERYINNPKSGNFAGAKLRLGSGRDSQNGNRRTGWEDEDQDVRRRGQSEQASHRVLIEAK